MEGFDEFRGCLGGKNAMVKLFGNDLKVLMTRDGLVAERGRVSLPTTMPIADSFFPVQGEGNYLIKNDRKILDWSSQGGISFLGHSSRYHKKMYDAIAEFGRSGYVSAVDPDAGHPLEVELKKRLQLFLPEEYRDALILFELSGGTANNVAVKIAQYARLERNGFGAFERAFHSRHQPGLDLNAGNAVHKTPQHHEAVRVFHFPYPGQTQANRLNEFCDMNKGRLFDFFKMNGFFMEFVQGEGGVYVSNYRAVQELVNALAKDQVLLIADECQTSIGRTGRRFAFEHFNVRPDVITMSKVFDWFGLALSAVVVKRSVLYGVTLPLGWHSGSMLGQPLPCLAGLVILEAIQENRLEEHARKMGNLLLGGFFQMGFDCFPRVKEIRGLGLMIGIEVQTPDGKPDPQFRSAVIKRCFEKGLIVITAGHAEHDTVIRLLPPLTTTPEEIEFGVRVISESIEECSKERR